MIGAIVGDIAGSRFEFANHKGKGFELFVTAKPMVEVTEESLKAALDTSTFTDDSVMTLAVADAILRWREGADPSYEALLKLTVLSMRRFGTMYIRWLVIVERLIYGCGARKWVLTTAVGTGRRCA